MRPTSIQKNLAKVILSAKPPVTKLDNTTYIINGVVSKKVADGWVLTGRTHQHIKVCHSKAAVILPWILNDRNQWRLTDRILDLDCKYAYALFNTENQQRLYKKFIANKEIDRALIHAVKYQQAKSAVRSINYQILNAISNVKINK